MTGVAYGNYVLEIKPTNGNETIDVSYQVICLSNEYTRDTITGDEANNINVAVLDGSQQDIRFGGSLMTSGSFTMMASNSM